jgi:hypothetical protein
MNFRFNLGFHMTSIRIFLLTCVVLLSACATSSDIVIPAKNESFLPAVGYMPACQYKNPTAFLGGDGNTAVLETACETAANSLAKIDGLTLKYPTQFGEANKLDLYSWTRQAARSKGDWIDLSLEKEKAAKYRLIFDIARIGSDGPGTSYINFYYTVQRISDGAIMKVQPRAGGEKNVGAAVQKYVEQIKRVLAKPASVQPEWHSPF